jgi:hypothetical protein
VPIRHVGDPLLRGGNRFDMTISLLAREETAMQTRFGIRPLIAVATVLTLGSSAVAQEGPPAGEPGQRTLVFRSLEDPTVSNQPQNCPFEGANLFLAATLWSMQTRASDSQVVVETVQQIGTAAACGLITTALVPSTLVPFYVEFTLDQGPNQGDTYIAVGTCQVITNNVPRPGVILAGCALRVTQGPQGFLGGAATSMSIFNPLHLPGAGTGSFWTLRAYTTAD